MRIAMWSGPRNLSTAMMYAFGAREDFAVIDEPFYAAYLSLTGLNHPMRDEIIASQPNDPVRVVETLTGEIPEGKAHFYQKHMTQHMVDGVPRNWIFEVQNVFLIRHPARVVASFSAKHKDPTLADIGFSQQLAVFAALEGHGKTPIVIDSADIRSAPEDMLRRLCDALGLEWDPAMLSWPKGGHKADGVWATHWYGAVHASTGFAGPEADLPRVDHSAKNLVRHALPIYELLREARI